MFRRILSLSVIFTFFLTSLGPVCPTAFSLEGGAVLPAPGTMVNLSPAYAPVIIKGLTVHKDNPFLFDFIVDVGQEKMSGEPLKKEGEKLIKYFLASLAIPDKDLWVNLSPYEKNRMIPEVLGLTDMGRDLLEQDYILKQITASLIYPEKQLGRAFWDKVYAKAQREFGTTEVPVNTFNKVWIMADKADVLEHGQTAFVTGCHLKVMLEEDYLALQKHQLPTRGHVPLTEGKGYVSPSTLPSDEGLNLKAPHGNNRPTSTIASNIVREIILPELEKEVNTGRNFANLRQIFNSIILSSWYKKNLKEALLNQVYSDQSKVKGINLKDPSVKEQIYEQYLKAYKKGVFNYIKEDVNSTGEMVPRKYFSGGFRAGVASVLNIQELDQHITVFGELFENESLVNMNAAMIGKNVVATAVNFVRGKRFSGVKVARASGYRGKTINGSPRQIVAATDDARPGVKKRARYEIMMNKPGLEVPHRLFNELIIKIGEDRILWEKRVHPKTSSDRELAELYRQYWESHIEKLIWPIFVQSYAVYEKSRQLPKLKYTGPKAPFYKEKVEIVPQKTNAAMLSFNEGFDLVIKTAWGIDQEPGEIEITRKLMQKQLLNAVNVDRAGVDKFIDNLSILCKPGVENTTLQDYLVSNSLMDDSNAITANIFDDEMVGAFKEALFSENIMEETVTTLAIQKAFMDAVHVPRFLQEYYNGYENVMLEVFIRNSAQAPFFDVFKVYEDSLTQKVTELKPEVETAAATAKTTGEQEAKPEHWEKKYKELFKRTKETWHLRVDKFAADSPTLRAFIEEKLSLREAARDLEFDNGDVKRALAILTVLKFSFDYYNNEKYLLNYKIENLLVLFSSQALPREVVVKRISEAGVPAFAAEIKADDPLANVNNLLGRFDVESQKLLDVPPKADSNAASRNTLKALVLNMPNAFVTGTLDDIHRKVSVQIQPFDRHSFKIKIESSGHSDEYTFYFDERAVGFIFNELLVIQRDTETAFYVIRNNTLHSEGISINQTSKDRLLGALKANDENFREDIVESDMFGGVITQGVLKEKNGRLVLENPEGDYPLNINGIYSYLRLHKDHAMFASTEVPGTIGPLTTREAYKSGLEVARMVYKASEKPKILEKEGKVILNLPPFKSTHLPADIRLFLRQYIVPKFPDISVRYNEVPGEVVFIAAKKRRPLQGLVVVQDLKKLIKDLFPEAGSDENLKIVPSRPVGWNFKVMTASAAAIIGLGINWPHQKKTASPPKPDASMLKVQPTRTYHSLNSLGNVNGGIDLSTSNGMQWKIAKDGKGVELDVNPAMIARVRREGISSLSPVIFRITPITSIWSLVGLQAPAAG